MRIRSFKRFAIGFVTVLALVVGYFWMQPARPVSSLPMANVDPDSTAGLDLLSTAQDSSSMDTVSVTSGLPPKKQPITKAAVRQVEREHIEDRPAETEQKVESPKAVQKPAPAPVACDRLVMRNGDLIDAEVSEVGIHEIRYKRCHLEDGPVYVVLKSEVLSIRFGNGDVDRF